jgi:hypothetical protein
MLIARNSQTMLPVLPTNFFCSPCRRRPASPRSQHLVLVRAMLVLGRDRRREGAVLVGNLKYRAVYF